MQWLTRNWPIFALPFELVVRQNYAGNSNAACGNELDGFAAAKSGPKKGTKQNTIAVK